MKSFRIFLAIVLAVATPLTALAQSRPSGGRPGGSGGRPGGGGGRPASSQSRPAQPQQRPGGGGRPQGGYDLSHDTQPRPQPPPAQRPAPPPNTGNRPSGGRPPNTGNRPPVNNPGFRPPPPNFRPPANRPSNPAWRPPNWRPTRPPVIVRNPVWFGRPAWGWNRGLAWSPAAAYWGGGFWGTLAIAAAQAAIFGYIVGANGSQWVSYQVQPNSPGAQLLMNYQLTQTPCGPPNLVVIYGPNDSVICAFPNNIVAPGVYSVDPSTLTISSF
jgi:hypothetical protein